MSCGLANGDLADSLFLLDRVAGDGDGEDAVFVLGVDVLFRGIADMEAAAGSAIEPLAADVMIGLSFLDFLFLIGDGDGKVMILEREGDILFLNARDLDGDDVGILVGNNVGPHGKGASADGGSLLIEETAEKGIEERVFTGGNVIIHGINLLNHFCF